MSFLRGAAPLSILVDVIRNHRNIGLIPGLIPAIVFLFRVSCILYDCMQDTTEKSAVLCWVVFLVKYINEHEYEYEFPADPCLPNKELCITWWYLQRCTKLYKIDSWFLNYMDFPSDSIWSLEPSTWFRILTGPSAFCCVCRFSGAIDVLNVLSYVANLVANIWYIANS